VLDCTSESDVQGFFSRIGGFDHLITTAGDKAVDAPIAQLDAAVARRVFDVKYWA
jgi:NAD(P)-dependent dehydrogenase (short-subunit alcohol dehydrogenase family)